MRGVLSAIWAVIIFVVVVAVVNLCAMLGFPPGSTSGYVMRIAGVILGLALAVGAYRRNSTRPEPPAPGQ